MSKELFLELCGYTCAILTLISYIPQIIKTLKTKHADDLSAGSWTMWLIGACIWEIYAVVDGGLGLIVSQTLELIMILTTLILAMIYRNSRNSNKITDNIDG